MSIKKSHELKGLQTRRAKLEVECKELLKEQVEANRKYCEADKKLKAINEQIKQLETESGEIIITEHAILRYIERKYGLDLEELKKEILSARNKAAIQKLGSGKYPIGDGYKAIVKGKSIVSITGW